MYGYAVCDKVGQKGKYELTKGKNKKEMTRRDDCHHNSACSERSASRYHSAIPADRRQYTNGTSTKMLSNPNGKPDDA